MESENTESTEKIETTLTVTFAYLGGSYEGEIHIEKTGPGVFRATGNVVGEAIPAVAEWVKAHNAEQPDRVPLVECGEPDDLNYQKHFVGYYLFRGRSTGKEIISATWPVARSEISARRRLNARQEAEPTRFVEALFVCQRWGSYL